MQQKSFWKRIVALALCALMAFSAVGISMNTAVAEEQSSEVVDYVLILNCTEKARSADKNNSISVRKAAAKMFVDLLPVDNARVALFVVGKPDSEVSQKSTPDLQKVKSYQLQADGGHMTKSVYRMRTTYLEWDLNEPIDTLNQRNALKDRIDNAYAANAKPDRSGNIESYSDAHCAVYAAVDLLKKYNSDNACILLISEEFGADYTGHKMFDDNTEADHTMWDDIEGDLKKHDKWVMNWVNLGIGESEKNKPNSEATLKLCEANRETISRLCRIHQGKVYDRSDSRSLPQQVASVISAYTGGEEMGRTLTLDSRGEITITLQQIFAQSFVMMTEANIVVMGNDVEVTTKGDDKNIWNIPEYDEGSNRRSFLFNAVKMIRPSSDWKVIIKGKAGTEVYIQIITTQEPDVELSCNVMPGQTVSTHSVLHFRATYTYAGGSLPWGPEEYEYYLGNAKLYYVQNNSGRTVDISDLLHVEGEQYVADFEVREAGTYSFYFEVSSTDFKSYTRRAEPIQGITVENHPPRVTGRAEDKDDVHVGTTLEQAVNVAALFEDPDGEPLNFECRATQDEHPADLEMFLDDHDFLTIKVPETEGDYVITLRASDPSGASAETSFILHVVNDRPRLSGSNPYTVKMITGAPKGLVSLGLLSKEESRDFEIDLNELFNDPDGLKLTFEEVESDLQTKDGEDIIEFTLDPETGLFKVAAKRKGTATVSVTAVDSSGAKAKKIEFIFVVRSAGTALLAGFWWLPTLLVIAAAVYIALMLSRRVKGSWTVEVEDHENRGSCSHDFRSLPASRDKMLKGTKVSLLAIAKRAVIAEGVQENVKLNRLSPDAVVFHGSLMQGKTVTFSCAPKARMAISVGENNLTARKKYKLNRNTELVVSCKDAENEEILTVKVSFR